MHTQLVNKLEDGTFTLGIVGMGYVGLPLVLTATERGLKVVGFDIDPTKVEALREGRSYIRHIDSAKLKSLVADKLFHPTTDFAQVSTCHAVLLCVPTPLTEHREPDMSYIQGTARSIGPHLAGGTLVVLESTTYPGTTDEFLRHELERASGKVAGQDFMLAYSPEREDPGNPSFDTKRIPKVVGGFDESSQRAAVALYERIVDRVIPVSSSRAAELTKLLENIFRNVNIALVNELKILSQRMNIDIWEVIDAAATKPFGYMPFYPGPGLGGHCIPIDPFYLTWKAREYELSTRFIELAGEINTEMPRYVIQRTAEALNHHKKALNGSKVLVLGAAYKRNVDDMRESPALRIIELLRERGVEVSYHDPFVPALPTTRRYAFELASLPLTEATLSSHDLALIVTDHTEVDYGLVVQHAPLVVDARNATRGIPDPSGKIFKA